MTEIALRTYNQEIKDLIDHGHFDEAIAHCQHILETYPRHIETYRLLGKAFLEQGRHGDAADVFQRVLSAMPEDWLSHVAMAIVREDESNLDMAIWHMERAYEVNPSNTTVQQEVRRLRGRRDGVEPPKLRLTRSALARMYIKGGLFGQAIAEIRSALAEDPERPDLQTLLASALFETGAVQEATSICSTILQKLPYCLEANRILGLALWASDKKEDAEKLFQRLESLNPYIDIDALKKDKRIQEHSGQAITLTRIEWEQQEKTVRSNQPTWASSLGLKIEEPQGRQAIPDWLASASQPAAPLTPASPAAAAPFGGPTPSWFNEAANAIGTGRPSGTGEMGLSNAPAEPTAAPVAKTGTGELPDWIQTQTNAAEPPREEKPSSPLPDWLAAPSAPPESMPIEEPAAPTTESTLPDWIRTVAPASTAPAEQISGIPDWLSAPPPASVEGLPPSSLPEWTKPETKTGPLEVEPGNIPDWLSTSKSTSSDVSAEPEWLKARAAAESTPDSIPEWMKTGSSADSSASAQPSMDKVPDWLQETPAPQSKPVEIIPEWMREESTPPPDMGKEKASTPFGPESNIPEWMKPEPTETPASSRPSMIPEPQSGSVDRIAAPGLGQPASTQDNAPEIGLPDWMTGAASSAPVMPAAIPPTPIPTPIQPVESTPEIVPEVTLPDWLKAIPSQAPIAPTRTPFNPSSAPPTPEQPVESAPEILPEVSLPDWLTSVAPPAPIPPAPIPSVPASMPPSSAASIPAPAAVAPPLAAVQRAETPAAGIPEVSTPDWLKATALPSPAASAPAPAAPPQAAVQRAEAPAAAISEVSLPDWLKGVTPPIPAASTPEPAAATPPQAAVERTEVEAAAIPEVSLPDWLKGAAPIPSIVPSSSTPEKVSPEPSPAFGSHVEAAIPEAVPDVNLPDWIKASVPSAAIAPTPAPSAPAAPPTAAQPIIASVSTPAAPAVQTPAAVEKPMESLPPTVKAPASSPISDGIDLPDWLVAQLEGKPAEHAPTPAGARPAVPMPDWLKPTTQNPASSQVVDWEKAAGQPLPSIPADATRPAVSPVSPADRPAPGAAEIPAWLDKSKPSGNETVARWLDRRLKTSTLSSLEDAVTRGAGKPPASTPSATPPSRPAQSSTQLPTWLDSQKPGGSDTVVRWMDKRETGSLRRTPQSAFTDAGKTAFPAPAEPPPAKPEIPQATPAAKPPVSVSGLEDTVVPRKPTTQDFTPAVRSTVESARPMPWGTGPVPSIKPPEPMVQTPAPVPPPPPAASVLPAEEEEEGAFIPPPEWLQNALGSAVEEVPPIPVQQAPVPEPVQPPPPPRTTVEEKPINVRWQPPSVEEPAPVSTAKPAPWVPISPPQAPPETAAKPVKKAVKKKTRKLTDIESEAMIREARVYLDTDLQKASAVYQKVIENPASAEVVANDLMSYLEQDPASPQLWNLLGDACSRAGRFQDAYRAYTEALRRM